MQDEFWIRRGSSLKGIGGIWALVTNVQGLTMHLRVVHVCWIQVQGMIRWFYIWNNGCNRRLVHSAWCTAEANTTETNTAHFVEYNASHGWISTVPVPPYIWNVYTTWLTLSMYTCDSCASRHVIIKIKITGRYPTNIISLKRRYWQNEENWVKLFSVEVFLKKTPLKVRDVKLLWIVGKHASNSVRPTKRECNH
jgi:hypothetical protein